MQSARYLQKHGHQWRFRSRLPAAAANRLGQQVLVVCLRTGDHREAVRRARAVRSKLERMTDLLSPTLQRAEANQRVRAFIDAEIDALETETMLRGGLKVFSPTETAHMGSENAAELEALFAGVFLALGHDMAQAKIRSRLTGIAPTNDVVIDGFLDAARPRVATGVLPGSPDARVLDHLMVSGLAELLQKRRALTAGEPITMPPTPQVTVAAASAAASAPHAQDPFLTWWDDYVRCKIAEKSWGPENSRDAEATRRLFTALVGPLTVEKIDKKLVGQFRADVFALPQKHAQQKPYKLMAPRDILTGLKTKSFFDHHGINPVVLKLKDVKTVEKHTTFLQQYWIYLGKNGIVPEEARNPFAGFGRTRKTKQEARNARKLWEQEQLDTLFTSPLFCGSQSVFRRSTPGDVIIRDARFWGTLMGPHLGARLSEICSMNVGDIVWEGEVPTFSIRGSKNKASDRNPPIPPIALCLGFLEYRYFGRLRSEPLFPELIPQGPDENRAIAFSRWFGTYRRGIGISDLYVDFHSFRANFITTVQNESDASIRDAWLDEVTGHTNPERQSERTRYTKTIWAENKLKVMKVINYGVDLSHLAYDATFGEAAPEAIGIIGQAVVLAEREMAKKAKGRIRKAAREEYQRKKEKRRRASISVSLHQIQPI
jgi:integrase